MRLELYVCNCAPTFQCFNRLSQYECHAIWIFSDFVHFNSLLPDQMDEDNLEGLWSDY